MLFITRGIPCDTRPIKAMVYDYKRFVAVSQAKGGKQACAAHEVEDGSLHLIFSKNFAIALCLIAFLNQR